MIRRLFLYIVLVAGLSSCVNESYFGESTVADIVKFTIQGEMSNKVEPLVDWRDVGTVNITVPSSFNLDSLKVVNAECSQLAHFEFSPDSMINFSQPVELWVVAERQSIKKRWIVTVSKQVVENAQLPFSDMMQWTPAINAKGVAVTIKTKVGYFPGNGVDYSPWNSTIEGNSVALAGMNDFSVYPNTEKQEAQYARLITHETTVGAAIGSGVATGGLFTGQFLMDPGLVSGATKYPRKMINAGVPFYSKPISVQLDVRYKAGAQMVDGKLKPITPGSGKPTKDSCDILFALQNRLSDPNVYIRVATASFRVPAIGNLSDDEGGFVTVTLPMIYGAPTAAQIAEKPYQKIGGSSGELTFYKFTKNGDKWDISTNPVTERYAADPENTEVDNVVVMFSSSTYGDLFYAAVGSTLDVKNIKFIYE